MPESDRILHVACHCGAHDYNFKVLVSQLPIKQFICHCNISRRISGCLFTSYVPIPSSNGPPDLTKLAKYASSSILNRYFCSTCSTHLYLEYNDDGHFEVSHGAIQGRTDDVLAFEEHMWIEDTKDGGSSIWLEKFNGKPITRWLVEPEKSPEVPVRWKASASATTLIPPFTDDKLRVHCHCDGVDFLIQRPTKQSLEASSPLPDLLVPYSSGQSSVNADNKPWWLSTDHEKYLAGHCACESCRRITGFDITPWTFIPVANFSLPEDKPFQLPFGTLKSYESTGGDKRRVRWFCSCCGANVFFFAEERPTLFDVSVGLLDAASGARAEEWLQWDTSQRISFSEDAHNVHLVRALEEGLIKWSRQ